MALVDEGSGGQPALVVASAHLVELLGAIDSVNNKAMFLVGLNVASNSLFVAVLAGLSQPWWAAIAPITITVICVGFGLWILWPRDISQFPSPQTLLGVRGLGIVDDELSWEIVATVAPISSESEHHLLRTSRRTSLLAVLTAIQLLGVIAIGLTLIA